MGRPRQTNKPQGTADKLVEEWVAPPVPEQPAEYMAEEVAIAKQVAAPTVATVTVRSACPWQAIQSAGRWFAKSQAQIVRLDDPGYPEWQANPYLSVEV